LKIFILFFFVCETKFITGCSFVVQTCVQNHVLSLYAFACVCVRQVRDGVHVLWVDNFSKTIARTIPTEKKGTYTPALWTGTAAFKGDTAGISDTIVVGVNGDVVPAMPDSLLTYKYQVIAGVEYVMGQGMFYDSQSLMRKYDVRNVPPKVDTRRHPEMKDVIDDGASSLANVLPVTLSKENIGSNRGLIAVIRELYVEYGMGSEECTRYLTLNLDENIFWRVLKVHTTN
jgi:hypothetical protein